MYSNYRNECGEKSVGDSKRFRELGNKAFKAGKDTAALRHYNEAVVAAPHLKGTICDKR